DIDTIFSNTVKELHQILKCDRLLISQFNPDWSGRVIAEAVDSGWISSLKEQEGLKVTGNSHQERERYILKDLFLEELVDTFEPDSDLQRTAGEKYVFRKKFVAVNDIYHQGFQTVIFSL
ncbi:MAG: GAF domain-containing protein, partial [Cyanobacteria bacterium J06600_6]